MPKRNWKREIIESKYKFFDEHLSFWEAPEPTDIIWENRDKTFGDQAKRKAIVAIVIILLLIGAFIAFFLLKKQTVTNNKIYPASVDCNSIDAMFPNKMTYFEYAILDEEHTEKERGAGIYQCFCLGLRRRDVINDEEVLLEEIELCSEYEAD